MTAAHDDQGAVRSHSRQPAPPAPKLGGDEAVETTIKVYLSPEQMAAFDEMCAAEYRQRSNMVGYLIVSAIRRWQETGDVSPKGGGTTD